MNKKMIDRVEARYSEDPELIEVFALARKARKLTQAIKNIKADISKYELDCQFAGDPEECQTCNNNIFDSIYSIIDKHTAEDKPNDNVISFEDKANPIWLLDKRTGMFIAEEAPNVKDGHRWTFKECPKCGGQYLEALGHNCEDTVPIKCQRPTREIKRGLSGCH